MLLCVSDPRPEMYNTDTGGGHETRSRMSTLGLDADVGVDDVRLVRETAAWGLWKDVIRRRRGCMGRLGPGYGGSGGLRSSSET